MGWKDRLEVPLRITTPDGKVYEPYMVTQTMQGSYEYNLAEFEFPGVVGTKVDRRLRKGVRYPMEFFFQGEDVIEQQRAFQTSLDVEGPSTILHPLYDTIIAHPISVGFNNEGANTVKFNIEFVETIVEDGPKTTFSPAENSPQNVTKATDQLADSFSSLTPTVSDVQQMKSNVDGIYKASTGRISGTDTFNQYFNAYRSALSKINTAFNDVGTAFTLTQAFISAPALFTQSVKYRLQTLAAQGLALSQKLENLSTANSKKIFEANKGTLVSAMVTAATTPQDGDYANATDVLAVIDQLVTAYNTYAGEVEGLQSGDASQPGAFIPDPVFAGNLNYAVNYAVSNLFEIALEAKQERIFYLENDDNVIVLTHRLYGLLADDSTIDKFIQTNALTKDELIQIKKGRRIVYYV